MELRPSQLEAAALIQAQPATLLAWPMGSGKTRAVLLALMQLKLMGIGPVLIVGTKKVIVEQKVWESEGFPLSFCLVHGGRKVREADIYLTTFDSLHTAPVQAVMQRCKVLVLDELSFLKSWGRRMKALRHGYGTWTHTIGLTGTPIGQNHENLFYQIQALDEGRLWGANKTKWLGKNFEKSYDGFSWDVIDPERLADDIAHMVHSVEGPELPPVVDVPVDVPMNAEQSRIYAEMRDDLIAQLEAGELVAANSAVASNKLRQCAAGFLYTDEGVVELSSAKRETVAELVEIIAAPVVCWYQFKHERDWLLAMGATEDIAGWLDVGGLLALHPASGGHGLNLQVGGCGHEVWASLPWSLEQWLQARARLARPGQEHDSVASHILMGAPIERRMLATLNRLEDVERNFLEMLR